MAKPMFDEVVELVTILSKPVVPVDEDDPDWTTIDPALYVCKVRLEELKVSPAAIDKGAADLM